MTDPELRNPHRVYQRHFLQIEWGIAFILAFTLILWSEKWGGIVKLDALLKSNRAAVYTALAAIFGSLLGFVITSVSILLPATQAPKLEVVANSRYYAHLWKTFTSAMWCTAFATISSLAALLFDKDASGIWFHRMFYVVFFASLLSAFRLWRCIWILDCVIRVVTVKRSES